MTAAEMYAAEKARRGIVMPRAEGCPRRSVRPGAPTTASLSQITRAERNREMARWYTEMPDWSLEDVCDHSLHVYGSRGVASPGHLSRVFRAMGVQMRERGVQADAKALDKRLTKLVLRIRQLEQDNRLLRSRVTGLRRRLKEAA